MLLSQSEKDYIALGVADNLRSDGRECGDWRPINFELNPIPQAMGSARVRIGATEALVSVKGNISQPEINSPDQGKLVCSVDCSMIARLNNDDRMVEERNAELSHLLREAFGSCIDLRLLCIVDGQHCWTVFIDVLLLDDDGNSIDVIMASTHLALKNSTFPKVLIEEGSEQMCEISLLSERDEKMKFPKLPLSCTVFLLGNGHLIDASFAEEVCSEAALVICICQDKIVAMRKFGYGLVDPGLLTEYISLAKNSLFKFSFLD